MHYLVTLWDGGGTVPAEIGVARRLVQRGHTVTVLADPTVEADATAVGAEFRSWRRAPHRRSTAVEDDLFRDWECRNPVKVLDRLCDRMISGPAADFAADTREMLTERRADAVVSSGTLLGALAAAESLGVPATALSPGIYSRPAPGLPPFGSGLPAARGPLARARDRVLNAAATVLWNRSSWLGAAGSAGFGLSTTGELRLSRPVGSATAARPTLAVTSRAVPTSTGSRPTASTASVIRSVAEVGASNRTMTNSSPPSPTAALVSSCVRGVCRTEPTVRTRGGASHPARLAG